MPRCCVCSRRRRVGKQQNRKSRDLFFPLEPVPKEQKSKPAESKIKDAKNELGVRFGRWKGWGYQAQMRRAASCVWSCRIMDDEGRKTRSRIFPLRDKLVPFPWTSPCCRSMAIRPANRNQSDASQRSENVQFQAREKSSPSFRRCAREHEIKPSRKHDRRAEGTGHLPRPGLLLLRVPPHYSPSLSLRPALQHQKWVGQPNGVSNLMRELLGAANEKRTPTPSERGGSQRKKEETITYNPDSSLALERLQRYAPFAEIQKNHCCTNTMCETDHRRHQPYSRQHQQPKSL